VDKEFLLQYLPAYKGNELIIEEDQSVHDIVREVLDAHREFAEDYDCIASFFDDDNLEAIFNFCKKNIRYSVEPEKDQTTRSPAATLEIGSGDCKHYAGFIGGILGALNRRGSEIDWCYRFASYDMSIDEPGHVFVVVKDGDDEIWIDPVLETFDERLQPHYIIDETPEMLTRLSGVQYLSDPYSGGNLVADHRVSGFASPIVAVNYSIDGNGSPNNPYFSGSPFLGLSSYVEDGGSALFTNWQNVADAINAAIVSGPSPGHEFDADFVKWVYQNNIKGWNFYYYGGVPPMFDPSAKLSQLNPNYPHVIITADGRLTFDKDVELDDAHTNEIHAVWAHVQDLINRFDTEDAAPMKPAVLKGFSQGEFGGITNGNLFVQYRGSSIFQQVGDFLENAVNFVKDIGIKIVMTPFRNAFLALVGINAFGMAKSLQNKITAGQWAAMSKTWQSIGGNPDKLKNTIDDGYNKPAAVSGIGTIEALMAAAAPVIAIMIKYLDKEGKLKEVFDATKGILKDQFDIDINDYGDLFDSTGKPVSIIIDPSDNENTAGGNENGGANNNDTGNFDLMNFIKDNPEMSAAGAGLVTYAVTSKNKNRVLFSAIAAAIVYFVAKKGDGGSTADQLEYIKSFGTQGEDMSVFDRMTATEINDVYIFFRDYVSKNITLPAGDLKNAIEAISTKYNIFT
jgi:hypothetical protein